MIKDNKVSENKVEKDEVWEFIESHNDGNPILTPNTIHISRKNLIKAMNLVKSSSQKEIDELKEIIKTREVELAEYKDQLYEYDLEVDELELKLKSRDEFIEKLEKQLSLAKQQRDNIEKVNLECAREATRQQERERILKIIDDSQKEFGVSSRLNELKSQINANNEEKDKE